MRCEKGSEFRQRMHVLVKSSAAAGVASEPNSRRSVAGSSPLHAIACTPRAEVHMKALRSPALGAIAASIQMPSGAPPTRSAASAKAPSFHDDHFCGPPRRAAALT